MESLENNNFNFEEEQSDLYSFSEDAQEQDFDISAEDSDEEPTTVSISHSMGTVFAFDWGKTLITAVALVVLLLTFVFRLVTIDGSSMEDTLLSNEKVILTTFNYTPHNGDIVAVSHGGNLNKTIIKRIIATEGQSIRFDYEKGQVIVDGVIIDEPYIKCPTVQEGNWEIPETIPEGYVFVMGDNREVSLDSRKSEVGLIPADDIIGKAQVIIFPFNRIKYLY